ncbi:MAG: MobF family relaxase [Acidiferrobacteraceae bacterium]
MISIKHLKSGGRHAIAAGVADYCQHTRDSEKSAGYYQSRPAPSEWLGRGARELGLEGPVQREAFIQILGGKLPDGTDISSRGHREGDRRMGTDLTISAPKSYSLLALGGEDDRLLTWHAEAVQVAAGVLEREALTARRGAGGVEVEHTGKMVAAGFTHEDTRTVDGRAAPDLHTHLIVANMTQRGDGQWAAMSLDLGTRNIVRMTADFAYKAHLASRLTEHGYQISRTKDGFEIAGISREQIEQFSPRKNQIDESLEKSGLSREASSARQRDAANLSTRGKKTTLSQEQQRWEWRREMREAGVQSAEITRDAKARELAGLAPRADLSTEAVRSATRHVAERETVFSRDQVRLQALASGMGNVTLRTVDVAVDTGAGGLIDVGGGKFTTRDALLREHDLLHRARAGQGQVSALMTQDGAQQFISAREKTQGFGYSDGQRQALELGLTSTDRVLGIVGAAGAGKTTAMKSQVEAAHALGHEVIGIAPSARARDELEKAGATVNRTVASFLARTHAHHTDRLVIMDESGMVSARDMDALLQKLELEGGRLVLVGDPRQLHAVEAGQPFAQLIESGAIRHAVIDEIQRQVDPDLREIAQRFADGDASGATRKAMDYATIATVVAVDPAKPTRQERQAGIAQTTAAAYLDLPVAERDQTLVLSATNAVRALVNEQVRAGLQERGDVSRDETKITALDRAGLKREEMARSECYEPGMIVRLEEGRGRERHTTDYQVDRTEGGKVALRDADGQEKLWNPAREKAAGVYQPREMHLAEGDQIIFRENHGRGEDKIVNGQTAKIESTGPDTITARLDNGREIQLDPAKNHSLDYGWCRTVHSAQGATVDRVIVAGEASRVATAASAYVACSRERSDLLIVTDSPEKLQTAWEKWATKEHALDAADAHALA